MAHSWVVRPSAVGSFDGWTLAAGANKVAAVDPGFPIEHDDNSSYLECTSAMGIVGQSFFLGTRPPLASLDDVQGFVRYVYLRDTFAGQLDVCAILGGSVGASVQTAAPNGPSWRTAGLSLPKPGGGIWALKDVLDSTLQIHVKPAGFGGSGGVDKFWLTSLWMEFVGSAEATGAGQARDVGSRELRLARRGFVSYAITAARPEHSHVRVGQVIPVSYRHGKSRDGLGWGDKPWQRRQMLVLGRTLDAQSYNTILRTLDLHDGIHLYSMWHTMRSAERPSAAQQGVVQADVGVQRAYTRNGKGWVLASDNVIYGVDPDVPRIGEGGQFCEPFRQNGQPRSSFRSGTTGWTLNATGGTLAADTSDLWFATEETPNSLKITKNGTGSPNGVAPNTVTYSANAKISISIYYRGDVGAVPAFQIQRTIDNFYLQSNFSWAVGVFTRFPPADGTKRIRRVNPFDVGASATALRVTLLQDSTAPNGATVNYYHLQVEEGEWHTSPIINDTAGSAVDRNIDKLDIWTDEPPHGWPVEHGTLWVRVVPDWVSTDVSSLFLNFLEISDGESPSKNYDLLYWHGPNGALTHGRSFNGSATESSKVVSIAARIPRVFAVRWCSEIGELGKAPYTFGVFVDGVSGTESVVAGTPIPAARRLIRVGHNNGNFGFGGLISDLLITPLVVDDETVADVSAALLVAG